MDIHVLNKRGLSVRHIARKLGMSRNTVRKYLENKQLEENYVRRCPPSKLTPYIENIQFWLDEDEYYSAVWIYDRLKALGFDGSYSIVKRKVQILKERLCRKAYIAFETEPGRQAQVDFGEFQIEHPDGSVEKVYLFIMVLGYSRKMYAELIRRCDMPSFLDCHIHAFSFFGGVPQEILYDRMRNVFIRQLVGRVEFNKTLVGFALHYGYHPLVAPAYAAWVKGKVERPVHFVRDNFWRGYPYLQLIQANDDLLHWLLAKESRVHGTTHMRIDERFCREAGSLGTLPAQDFDTSWRVFRKVHKDCTVRFECNRYVVSHRLVKQKVLLRVKDRILRVFSDDTLVVTYTIPEGKGHLIQDPRFYEALRKDREMNKRKYSYARPHKGRAKRTIGLVRMAYDMDVAVRPVADYDDYAEAV